MNKLKEGDIVTRKSYGMDLIFKVKNIISNDKDEDTIELKGVNYRISADAPMSDLVMVSKDRVKEFEEREKRITALHNSAL